MAEELKTMEIVVDDGSQRVPIRNTAGEQIGEFRFKPTDIGIIQRYNDIAGKFHEIVEPLEKIDISADGTAEPDDSAAAEALKAAESRLFEACDYLFGGNMSEAFFGSMHPFSPINGSFYCETVLTKVGEFISSQFAVETKKIGKRLGQYVGKYGKKK